MKNVSLMTTWHHIFYLSLSYTRRGTCPIFPKRINTKDNLDIIMNEEGEELPFKVIFIDKTVNKCHVEVRAASKKGEKIAR